MVKNRNFTNQPTPAIVDLEYVACNFLQSTPVEVGGVKRGVRLFPGDDTPRTFRQCNMTNCEPPPGSVLIGCNTTVCDYAVRVSVEEAEIEGEVTQQPVHADIIYGRYDARTNDYIYLPAPVQVPFSVVTTNDESMRG